MTQHGRHSFQSPETNSGPGQAWLQLLRIANLPSAWANILMGFLWAHQAWIPLPELVCLLLASTGFYLGGMVLNDLFDVEVDRRQRPERPLPAGEISLTQARLAGWGLIVSGIVFSGLAAVLSAGFGSVVFERVISVALLLGLCVVLYDGPLKRTWLAPVLMGGCRLLNVLLGASTMPIESPLAEPLLGYPVEAVWAAVSIGVLIWGITLLGRKEAVAEQPQSPLVQAAVLVVIGLAGVGFLPFVPGGAVYNETAKIAFPLFILLIAVPIVRRVLTAVFTIQPGDIQKAVVSVLRSLIVLDAAICFLAAPQQPWYALAVLSLMVPGFLLSRIVRQT